MVWKSKPYWSWGRVLHFAEGGLAPFIAFKIFGIPGLAWGTAITIAIGLAWELLNSTWPGGRWMFSDIVDFLFFVFGAAVCGYLTMMFYLL